MSAAPMPRVVAAGVPRRMPLGRSGGFGSSGMICLLVVIATRVERLLGDAAVDAEALHGVEHHHVVVGAAGDEVAPRSSSPCASALAFASTCAP